MHQDGFDQKNIHSVHAFACVKFCFFATFVGPRVFQATSTGIEIDEIRSACSSGDFHRRRNCEICGLPREDLSFFLKTETFEDEPEALGTKIFWGPTPCSNGKPIGVEKARSVLQGGA